MEVRFLGTGAGLPSKYRNTQSVLFDFMQELKECWLFDCGEATQHQILKTNIKPSKINRIFISHMHGDHILGLIGFLSSRSFQVSERNDEITIYGPKGIEEFVKFNIKATKSMLTYNINFVEYDENQVIYEDSNVIVKVYELFHTITSYGFKIKFKKQKGALDSNKLKELGIAPGPIYREIKSSENFEYQGKKYLTRDFLGEDKPERTIFFLADTSNFSELKMYLEDVDILITECTYLKAEEKELAKKHRHLCVTDIYDFSKIRKFDKIYLTHISARYDKSDLLSIQNNLLENIFIVADFDNYSL